MKKLGIAIMFGIALSISQPVQAEKGGCEIIATFAKTVMDARQRGVPLTKVMKITEKKDFGKQADDIIKDVIIKAYKHPNYHTEKMEQRTITEFENEVYRNCLVQTSD